VEPRRRSLRLAGFDYSQPGAYFVTICTGNRRCTLGEIRDCEMRLNHAGQVIAACWDEIPLHFPNAELDAFVVMPNHVHGILVLTEPRARHASPLHVIVSSFKAAVSKRIGRALWQRNYFEHVIRGEKELNRIRGYIEDNPANWPTDEENPDCPHL
jgi:putative transposase